MVTLIPVGDVHDIASAPTDNKIGMNLVTLNEVTYLQIAENVGTTSHTETISSTTTQDITKQLAAGRVIVATKTINETTAFVWELPSTALDMAGEANSGISFMGVTTTVLALFVGFGFSALPPVINAVLVAGLVSCLAALLAYTNSTGVVARLGGRNATRYMEVGNVLSEFGGIKLLFLVAPAALAIQSAHIALSLLVAAIVVALLFFIHNEKMNITIRYFTRRTENFHVIGDSLVAISGAVAAQNEVSLAIWAVVVIGYLLGWGALSWKKQEKLDE